MRYAGGVRGTRRGWNGVLWAGEKKTGRRAQYLCLVWCFILALCLGPAIPALGRQETAVQEETVQEKAAVQAKGNVKTITITALGDVTIGGDPRRNASQTSSQKFYEKLSAQYSGNFFKNVRQYFTGSAELTLANLESSFTTATRYKNKSYIFRAKPSYARILSSAGIDVVSHANNHAQDFNGGIRSTRAAVRARGMAYVGNGVTAIVKKNGIKVGFCAFYDTGNITAQAQNVVKRLKEKCHLVVVSMHWGQEYRYAASSSQRSLGRALIRAGADLVVGHHSHVVGGIEKYQGKYIVYSLGTFSSMILTPKDMDTMIFRQTFSVNTKTKEVRGSEPGVLPCSMSSRASVNDGRPTPLTGQDKERVIKKINRLSLNFSL